MLKKATYLGIFCYFINILRKYVTYCYTYLSYTGHINKGFEGFPLWRVHKDNVF